MFQNFSLLDALKPAFQMRHLIHRWKESGYLFLKPGHFFVSTFKKCSGKIAVTQNIVLHCRYFVPVIKIFGKFEPVSLKLLLSTSFTLQFATLLKHQHFDQSCILSGLESTLVGHFFILFVLPSGKN